MPSMHATARPALMRAWSASPSEQNSFTTEKTQHPILRPLSSAAVGSSSRPRVPSGKVMLNTEEPLTTGEDARFEVGRRARGGESALPADSAPEKPRISCRASAPLAAFSWLVDRLPSARRAVALRCRPFCGRLIASVSRAFSSGPRGPVAASISAGGRALRRAPERARGAALPCRRGPRASPSAAAGRKSKSSGGRPGI